MSSIVDAYNTFIYVLDLSYKIIGITTMILGTIGNLCNCFVFLCIPALRKHPNSLFIVASAVGSLIYINVGLFPGVCQILSGSNPLSRSLFLCKTNYWVTYSSGSFSFMCNCYAALGQFLITLPQIRWHQLITRVRALLMILFTALFWLLIFLPLPIYFTLVPISNNTYMCTSIPTIAAYGNCLVIIGYYLIPMILIVIFFAFTWYNLIRLRRRLRRLDTAVTRMMLVQMSILLINGIPAATFLIYLLASLYTAKTIIQAIYEQLALFLIILTTLFTSGTSFWVYLIVSGAFRKHIKEFLCKYLKFKPQVTPFPVADK